MLFNSLIVVARPLVCLLIDFADCCCWLIRFVGLVVLLVECLLFGLFDYYLVVVACVACILVCCFLVGCLV